MKHIISRCMAIFTVLAAVMAGQTAQAEIVYTKKDWSLDITNNICTALTGLKVQGKTYYLMVVVDTDGKLPAQVMVYPKTQPAAASGYTFDWQGTNYQFAKLPDGNNGTNYSGNTFWSLPVDTAKIIDYIKRYNTMSVYSIDNNQVYPFSLSGSSLTVGELETRCASNSLFAAQDFEQMFLPGTGKSADINAMTEDIAVELRTILEQAVEEYRAVMVVQKELDDLEARYAQWTAELNDLNTSIAYLENDRLPYLRNEKVGAEQAIDRATKEKADYLNRIDQERIRLDQAQRDYQNALDAIAPYTGQHDDLLRRWRNAQDETRRAENELSNIRWQIDLERRNLAQLQREADSLQNEIQNLEQQRVNTRRELDQAQSDLNNFNPQQEIQKRKQNNSQLRQVRQQIQQLNQEIPQQRQRVQQRRQEMNQKQKALEDCRKATPGKCQAERQAFQQAKQQFEQAQQRLQNMQQRRQNLEQQRQQIVQRIENNVAQEEAQLRQRVRNLENRLAQIRNQIQDRRERRRQIVQVEIPQKQRRLDDLRFDEQNAVNNLSTAQNDERRAERDYVSFKQSVGYDQLEADVRRTRATVDQIESRIATYQNEVRKRDRTIADQTRYRDQLVVDIQSTIDLIASKKDRRIVVQDLLKPYDDEKSEILVRLDEKKAILQQTAKLYESTLP
ncbi:MAG: hypothetical protein KDD33_07155 [Bdellovibrionales bacterium]|nr:hypothetical protein [Bdellovibrionales bacterium]